jgi:hypothetical protein
MRCEVYVAYGHMDHLGVVFVATPVLTSASGVRTETAPMTNTSVMQGSICMPLEGVNQHDAINDSGCVGVRGTSGTQRRRRRTRPIGSAIYDCRDGGSPKLRSAC